MFCPATRPFTAGAPARPCALELMPGETHASVELFGERIAVAKAAIALREPRARAREDTHEPGSHIRVDPGKPRAHARVSDSRADDSASAQEPDPALGAPVI